MLALHIHSNAVYSSPEVGVIHSCSYHQSNELISKYIHHTQDTHQHIRKHCIPHAQHNIAITPNLSCSPNVDMFLYIFAYMHSYRFGAGKTHTHAYSQAGMLPSTLTKRHKGVLLDYRDIIGKKHRSETIIAHGVLKWTILVYAWCNTN